MLDKLTEVRIILASNSPRRRELLTNLGITFSPFVIFGIDRSYPSDLKGEEVALFVAEKKAAAYKEHIRDNRLIITADTIVSTAEGVLGKPPRRAGRTGYVALDFRSRTHRDNGFHPEYHGMPRQPGGDYGSQIRTAHRRDD